MITTLPGAEAAKPGIAGRPLPGVAASVVDEEGKDVEPGQQGLLVIERPWPGMLRTLYKEDDRFVETYFDRLGKETYVVGDAARVDEDGYISIVGRIDDVINVSGHRMSTAEVESAIVSHSLVAEAAVIGQSDEDSGQAIVAFVTLESGREGDDDLVADIREHVARRSASSHGPSGSCGPTTCPRRARARSCGGCCATSPRGPSSVTSRRCAIRPSSTSSRSRSTKRKGLGGAGAVGSAAAPDVHVLDSRGFSTADDDDVLVALAGRQQALGLQGPDARGHERAERAAAACDAVGLQAGVLEVGDRALGAEQRRVGHQDEAAGAQVLVGPRHDPIEQEPPSRPASQARAGPRGRQLVVVARARTAGWRRSRRSAGRRPARTGRRAARGRLGGCSRALSLPSRRAAADVHRGDLRAPRWAAVRARMPLPVHRSRAVARGGSVCSRRMSARKRESLMGGRLRAA